MREKKEKMFVRERGREKRKNANERKRKRESMDEREGGRGEEL